MFMTKSSVLGIGEIENNRVDVDNGILWTWPECDVGFGFGWRSQEDWFYILLEPSIWIFIHIIVIVAASVILLRVLLRGRNARYIQLMFLSVTSNCQHRHIYVYRCLYLYFHTYTLYFYRRMIALTPGPWPRSPTTKRRGPQQGNTMT